MTLIKYLCFECEGEFLLNQNQAGNFNSTISCPFCCSPTKAVAYGEVEDLGCLGIGCL